MNFPTKVLAIATLLTSNASFANQVNQESYRNIFIQSLEQNFQKDSDKLIYMPTAEMDEVPLASSAQEFMDSLDETYRAFNAQELYNNGSKQAYTELAENLNNSVDNQPLTIVVVPGIFSEFIETRAFEEVFRNKNTYSGEFKAAYSKSASNIFDDSYSSLAKVTVDDNKLPQVIAPLTELIDASNIGKNIKVIILRSPLMSLESVGDIDDKAKVYNRRLDKFFKLMGTPKNIAFIGYSRGATISLEMLAQLKGSNYAWAKNVKAMVSLGGVTYGSDTADLATCDNPTAEDVNPNCASLYLVKKLVKELEYVGQESDQYRFTSAGTAIYNYKTILRNNKRWTTFFKKMAKYNISFDSLNLPEDISIRDVAEAFKKIANAAKQQLNGLKSGDFKSTSELIFSIAFKNFSLDEYLADYDKNLKKFKLLVAEITKGAEQLSTKERFEWWSTNELPTKGIHYYSLAGTMAHQKSDFGGFSLGSNTSAYNPLTADFKILNDGYNQYVKDTGFELNDSQVAVHKVKFWPRLNSLLNPYYENNPIKTTFLGVLGVHHWGLTLEVANKMKVPAVNPFPRVSLLKSLAKVIAIDIDSNEK